MKKSVVGGIVVLLLLSAIYLCYMAYLGDSPTDSGGIRPASWAEPIQLAHSENFHRVTPDVYRSAQPSREGMKAYAAFGIKSVINLRSMHSDADAAKGTPLVIVEIPLHAWSAGNDDNVIAILQAIRDAEKPVLIHCQHGADRTGLAIAMYRIVEQGWRKEDALAELTTGGFGYHSIWKNIATYIEKCDVESIRRSLKVSAIRS